ncbi:MAG: terminase small subunit, partial [Alphaproteobacteria bacterium]|nr:terminase small subunit [Alphaproteobacteria bacterium]
MPIIDPAIALSTRQEAFCRYYAASGNAADAARQAGYSERSVRQTGCALLERPYVVERLRRIRLSWKRTERDEAQIVLARLEQAWDAAVASGSAYMMVRVLRFQAEITGLVGSGGGTRARLWPVAHEDELGEIGAG